MTIQTTDENTKLHDLDAATLKQWLEQEEAVLVDVRTPSEHATERIIGSTLIPLAGLDASKLPEIGNKKLVVHCQSGMRSAIAVSILKVMGFDEIYHLQGGLPTWKKAGYEVERAPDAPMDLQRQVQIGIGAMILLGTLASIFVSPWFLTWIGLVGTGLLFAGMTGTCGMAMFLAKMPWNQKVGTSCLA
ncbi:rhodanese-like domain-containing protein [Candidatus Latescibacteria bacterium]|jgi:rhodanese-related sulfurtransferase|nr:rhodanese-like domain-containing protein [Candidatus Latescibacterota bacterium]